MFIELNSIPPDKALFHFLVRRTKIKTLLCKYMLSNYSKANIYKKSTFF